jgi:acetyl-CoA acetyltransferase
LAHTITHWQTDRWPYAPFTPDALLVGCANQAGEDARNLARLVALLAGLPASTLGITYHALCLSGVAALHAGVQGLRTGQWQQVLVAAAEHMSRAPLACLPQHQHEPNQWQNTVFGWRFTNPKFTQAFNPHWPDPTQNMVSLANQLAHRQGYSPEQLNALSWQSRQQALIAAQHGYEEQWVIPYPPANLLADEALAKPYTQAGLARLRPLQADGEHTAGTVARWGDGCVMLALTTEEQAQAQGWPVMAVLQGEQWLADAPHTYGELTHRVGFKLLTSHGVMPQALTHAELHEGFAATFLYTAQQLSLSKMSDVLNPWGGALALGMPQALAGLWAVYRLVARLALSAKGVGLAVSPGGMGQAYACLLTKTSV